MSKTLPQGWKEYTLKECTTFLDGLRKPVKEQDRVPGPYPYYGANGIQGNIDSYIFDEELVLLAEDGGHFGSKEKPIAYMIEGKSWVNNHAHVLRANKEIITTKYLCKSLSFYNVMKYVTGSTRLKLTKGAAEKIVLKVPPLEEQERIVSILERAEDAICKREECNRLLDEYLKSVFVDIFGDPVTNPKGWDKKKLSELGEFKNGMNFNKSDFGYSIKFLGVSEFKYGNVINDVNILPSLDLLSEPSQDYLLKKGDIVFVRSNGSKELVGRSVLIGDLVKDTTYSGFCIRYRNKSEKVTPDYLISLFSNDGFKSSFKQDSRGCSINNLNQKILGDLNIIIPPIELQEKFTEIVCNVESMKKKQIISDDELNNLFNSLMQRAFNGEL